MEIELKYELNSLEEAKNFIYQINNLCNEKEEVLIESKKTVKLTSFYIDSEDLKLSEIKLSCRLREKREDRLVKNKYVFTIKDGGHIGEGLHFRNEVDVSIDEKCFLNLLNTSKCEADSINKNYRVNSKEFYDVLNSTELKETFDLDAIREVLSDKDLIVAVATYIDREKFTLNWKESLIEIAIDEGTVSAFNGMSEKFLELEAELIKGEVDDIKDFSLWVRNNLDFKSSSISKHKRGLNLLK